MIRWEALPAHWDIVRIEDVGTIISGGTPSRDVPSYWDGDIPWVTPSEITSLKDKWLSNTREHITNRGLQYSSARLLPPASLLVTSRATVGEVAIARNAVTTNQGFKSLVTNAGNDPVFYYYVMKYISSEMVRLASGSTFDEISKRDFSKIRVPHPPLPEQRAIAHILDTIDREIQETNAIIDKLQQVKTGLLDDLFIRGLDENGDLRDSEQMREKFEYSRFGLYPKAWKITALGIVIRENGGFIQTGPFGTQLHSYEYQDDGVPVIMPQDIIDGFIIEDQIARISPEKANKLSRHLVQENDVIFARRGDISRCAPIEPREVGWLCGTGCLLIRPPANVINGYWLAYAYRQPVIQNHVLARAVGSTMVNLNTSILMQLTIALPPLHEQHRIVTIALQHDERIRKETEYQAKLRLLKQGAMDDLLTGRVDTTNINIDAEIDSIR